MDTRLLRKDGTLVWAASTVSALRDKDGGFQQATAIIVDITERKRAQDVERRLAAIIASYNDAIPGIVLGMKITRWNTGAGRLYGYAAGAVVGRSALVLVKEDRQSEKPAVLRRVCAGLMARAHDLHDPRDMGAGRMTGDRRAVDSTPFPGPICGHPPFNPGPPTAVVSICLSLQNSPRMQSSTVHCGRPAPRLNRLDGKKSGTGSTTRLVMRWGKPGAPVTPPTCRGFGSWVIESLLAAELNGTVKITYGPKGVVREADANLLKRMGSAAEVSLSWKAWGAFPAMIVDRVRDHNQAQSDFSLSLATGVITAGQ